MGTNTDLNVLSHVLERDIDLLLIEEFLCNDSFLTWFSQTVAKGMLRISGRTVAHSVFESQGKDSSGETDIRIQIEDDKSRYLFFVENKITAEFTPEQPERYRERSKKAVAAREADFAFTVLLAPEAYLNACGSADVFDVVVSYEQICECLHRLADASTDEGTRLRLQHRQMVLRHAITKHRRNGVGHCESVTAFFDMCHQFIVQEYGKQLSPRPRQRGPNSDTIVFDTVASQRLLKALGAPRRELWLALMLGEGRVGVRFYCWRGRADQIEVVLNQLKTVGMEVLRKKESNTVEIGFTDLPKIDCGSDFGMQIRNFRTCLEKAVLLADWLDKNREDLELGIVDHGQTE